MSDFGLSVGTPVKESRLEQFEFFVFINALLHLALSNLAIYGRAWEVFNVESVRIPTIKEVLEDAQVRRYHDTSPCVICVLQS